VVINSSLLSAQNRHRHYWANWDITQPEDKGILLRDVLEDNTPSEFNLSDDAISYMNRERNGKPRWEYHKNPVDGKAAYLTANMHKGVPYGALRIHGGAIRGRYNADGSTSQKIECNNQEKTNSLTTVQKDNVVIFRPCERIKDGDIGHVANATDINGMDCIKRVYGSNGKAPTLTTMSGGHREPKVVVRATVQANAEHTYNEKTPTLTASMGMGGGNVPLYTNAETAMKNKGKYIDKDARLQYRKLTPTECARLQTFPDGWCEQIISKSQSYKAYGNSWTVDVIAHIFKGLKNDTTAT